MGSLFLLTSTHSSSSTVLLLMISFCSLLCFLCGRACCLRALSWERRLALLTSTPLAPLGSRKATICRGYHSFLAQALLSGMTPIDCLMISGGIQSWVHDKNERLVDWQKRIYHNLILKFFKQKYEKFTVSTFSNVRIWCFFSIYMIEDWTVDSFAQFAEKKKRREIKMLPKALGNYNSHFNTFNLYISKTVNEIFIHINCTMLINGEMFGILSPDYFLSELIKNIVISIKLKHDMQKKILLQLSYRYC